MDTHAQQRDGSVHPNANRLCFKKGWKEEQEEGKKEKRNEQEKGGKDKVMQNGHTKLTHVSAKISTTYLIQEGGYRTIPLNTSHWLREHVFIDTFGVHLTGSEFSPSIFVN